MNALARISRFRRRLPALTFWRVVAALILVAGAVGAWLRYTRGLGAVTNLSDDFPWGLWIGFDVLCGVGLAAGGFTLAAAVHVFRLRRFEPIARPAILTAFLGYLLVIVALLLDLGRPLQIWHALVMWNPRSVMFEVAWCVMLYTTVLALEFAPVLLERLRAGWALQALRVVTIPLVVAGVLLSTLHQSSLGSLYLIVPEKLYPLWYTPWLPVLFFVSAVAAGCAMVIFESFLSSRAFRRGLELELLAGIGGVMVVALIVGLAMRVADLAARGALGLLLAPRGETAFYWAEILVGAVAPLLLLARAEARRSRNTLFAGAILVVIGFVLDRLNVSLTGFEAWTGRTYFPSWVEIAVTLSIVTVGFIAFAWAARHLPVFAPARTASGRALSRELARDLRRASRAA